MPSSSNSPSGRIATLLVDDEVALRMVTKRLLERSSPVLVVGEVGSAIDAVRFIRRTTVDVIVMDYHLPGPSGPAAVDLIRAEESRVPILIHSGSGEYEHALAATRAGAAGFVVKRADADELALAIQEVYEGRRYFSADFPTDQGMRLRRA